MVNAITPEFETNENQQDSTFGVDSHEITEHHLQAALSSNQAESAGNASNKKYHIPTPQSVEVMTQMQYNEEYPPNSYLDPVTYICFSDTVESCNKGSPYCMDEDDKGWLDKHNEKVQANLAKALKDQSSDSKTPDTARIEALVRKDATKYRFISEDEFETVMYVFERTTCERHPLLELDMSKLPSLSELLPQFEQNSSCSALALPELPSRLNDLSEYITGAKTKNANCKNAQGDESEDLRWSAKNPFRHLFLLKPCAHAIYSWWKLRRQAREGKQIVPVLNADESNENDPYVCFRRREVKVARKTRKTDTLQLEKLVRLESELRQATALCFMVTQRERMKEHSVGQAKACWTQAHELMSLKRRWGIQGSDNGQEDEQLLFGVQPDPLAPVSSPAVVQNAQLLKKKRKADEAAVSTSSTTLKLRRPKTEPEQAQSGVKSSTEPAPSTGASTMMERIVAVQQYIERECALRQQADAGVEDLTDFAFQPAVAPPPLRAFRPIQSDNNDTHFWSNHPFARPGRQSCFRRRVGRGGRVFLDRRPIAVSPAPANIGAWPRQRQNGFPLATFGYDRSTEGTKRIDKPSRANGSLDPHRTYAPATQSMRVTPMLLPTPDLSWDPLNSKDPRAPLAHDPDLHFGHVSKESVYGNMLQHTDAASTASDSSAHTHSSDDMGDGQSTQATDIEQESPEVIDKGKVPQFLSQSTPANNLEDSFESVEEQMERAQKLAERWRYNEDGGRYAGLGLLGLGGMEGDEEAVLDDYDQRFIRYRMSLLDEANLLKLSTDWTYMRQALIAASTNMHAKPALVAINAQKDVSDGKTQAAAASGEASTKAAVSSNTKDGQGSEK